MTDFKVVYLYASNLEQALSRERDGYSTMFCKYDVISGYSVDI